MSVNIGAPILEHCSCLRNAYLQLKRKNTAAVWDAFHLRVGSCGEKKASDAAVAFQTKRDGTASEMAGKGKPAFESDKDDFCDYYSFL